MYLAKGGDLKGMLCELHCRANGCVGSRGGSMHLIDKSVGMAGTSAIVGGAVPIAAGAALAQQMKGENHVVTVFIGDATTEEGVTSETLNFSALKQLPLVFFCENNFYSVQSPLFTRQPPRELHRWAAAHLVPSTVVDGANVLAVLEATQGRGGARAKRWRSAFIEAQVYRLRAHGGAGDDSHTGYRDRPSATLGKRSIRSRCSPTTSSRADSSPRQRLRKWSVRSQPRSPRPSNSR